MSQQTSDTPGKLCLRTWRGILYSFGRRETRIMHRNALVAFGSLSLVLVAISVRLHGLRSYKACGLPRLEDEQAAKRFWSPTHAIFIPRQKPSDGQHGNNQRLRELMSIAAISKRKQRAMLDLARIQIAARFARGRGRSLALSPLLQRDSPDCACPQASQQLTACYCWCASRPRQRPGQARQNRPLKVASSIASARTAAPTASFQRQATVQIAPV